MFLARQDTAAPFPMMSNLPPVSLESRGSFIITITAIFTGFACTAVLARLYVRAYMLKKVGIDDYILIVSMACTAAVLAFTIKEVRLGVGEHWGNPHQLFNLQEIFHWSYFHAWIIVLGNSSVKLSVGFFLLRLVQGRWYKRFIIAWIVFLFIFTAACLGTLIFQCLPVNGAWNMAVKLNPKTKCYSTNTYRSIGLMNGAINMFTDFVFASLPIPIILPLQINTRTKISLVCILSLGYFACAAAIVKEVLLVSYFTTVDILFENSFQIWNVIEINTGILAACLPALRPIFAFLIDTAKLRSSVRRTGGSRRTGHYYVHEDDDVKLSSLPSRSTISKYGGAYGVSVVGGIRPSDDKEFERILRRQGSSVSSGPMSRLEASIRENDSGSEDNILPQRQLSAHLKDMVRQVHERERNRGIVRTTEVRISR